MFLHLNTLFPFVFIMSIVHSRWRFELFEKKMWMAYNNTSKQFTTFKLKSVYMAKFFLWTMWCTHTKRNPILTNLIGDNILQTLEHQDTIYIKVDSPTCYVRCRKSTRNQSLHDHWIHVIISKSIYQSWKTQENWKSNTSLHYIHMYPCPTLVIFHTSFITWNEDVLT